MAKLNIVIADDHPIVLLGVRELVERDERFRIVGESTCSSGLIEQLKQKRVDLLISDYNMPGPSPYGDGLKLVEYLRRHFPDLKILILTMISNQLILSHLHQLGVVGVIQKSQIHTEIQRALDTIIQGSVYDSPEPARISVIANKASMEERFATLSLKEMEILRLFVSGMSISEIARNQKRSVKTVSTQKVSAMRKLAVTRDQELLAYCMDHKAFR